MDLDPIRLSVRAGGVPLETPLLVAAGPWSSGEEPGAALAGAGAIVAKTVTAAPRAGNPPPVLLALPEPQGGGGYLNRVGLRNPGVHELAAVQLPRLLALGPPVLQSFTAQEEGEVESVLAALEPLPLGGYELNASCPNVPGGQLPEDVLRRLLRRARALTSRPLWVKLAYAPADLLVQRARIAADEGADAISAINTLPALHVDPSAAGSRFTGGLSGPPLTPLAQWAVDQLVRGQPLPVIAIGGVSRIEHVLAFLSLGAAAVQIGSHLLDEPEAAARLRAELATVCGALGVASFDALRALLRDKRQEAA